MKSRKSQVAVLLILVLIAGVVFILLARGEDDTSDNQSWKLVKVVDGDTFDVADETGTVQRVRPVGIDTPEPGKCGASEASQELDSKLSGKEIKLVLAGTADRDKYGRLLRYVEVDGDDIGLSLIQAGLANAAYDSRTSYPKHFREDSYIKADAESQDIC